MQNTCIDLMRRGVQGNGIHLRQKRYSLKKWDFCFCFSSIAALATATDFFRNVLWI